MHRYLFKILSLLILWSMSNSCEPDDRIKGFVTDETRDITEFLESNPDTYGMFWKIVQAADLVDPLSAQNPFGDGFTLFLPTDDAVRRYIDNNEQYSSFEEMLADKEFIRELARYHIVNRAIRTNEFPFGALPDTTASGDYLTIGFSTNLDTTIYKVNNLAPVIEANIELINGYIHVIGEMLNPVVYSSYDWLVRDGGYTILSDALRITGLKDTLGIYRTGAGNRLVRNNYTLLAEHDSIYQRSGIMSIDDLISRYATPGRGLTDRENGIYQFAAYHILEHSYYIDDFISGNYNTYASSPVSISVGLDLRINAGSDTFDIEVANGDTNYITYNRFLIYDSNIPTKNGAIHLITDVLELFRPHRSDRYFQFLEDPLINADSKLPNTYEYFEPEKFELISWTGPESIIYYKTNSDDEKAANKDYIRIEGQFTLDYRIPKILPGKYKVKINVHAFSPENAMIQFYLDGKKLGPNLDLTRGGSIYSSYHVFDIGVVEFGNYTEHQISIRSLIPGVLIWDYTKFEPK